MSGGRAMNKLQDIVADCRETLAQNMNNYDTVTKKSRGLPWSKTSQPAAIPAHIVEENKQNTQLLDAIAHAIATGQKRGIITAPQHVAQLTKPAQLALTALVCLHLYYSWWHWYRLPIALTSASPC